MSFEREMKRNTQKIHAGTPHISNSKQETAGYVHAYMPKTKFMGTARPLTRSWSVEYYKQNCELNSLYHLVTEVQKCLLQLNI